MVTNGRWFHTLNHATGLDKLPFWISFILSFPLFEGVKTLQVHHPKVVQMAKSDVFASKNVQSILHGKNHLKNRLKNLLFVVDEGAVVASPLRLF